MTAFGPNNKNQRAASANDKPAGKGGAVTSALREKPVVISMV
jgi:hypothetical protein